MKVSDIGNVITVKATFADAQGSPKLVTSPASAPVVQAASSSNVIPTDYILAYDFNGDLLDKSVNDLHGTKTGTSNFVTGRKVGTQALEFISCLVSTPAELPINSDKLTVSFWINSSSDSVGRVFELSPLNTIGSYFSVFTSHRGAGRLSSLLTSTNTSYEVSAKEPLVEGVFYHVLIAFDRSSASEKNIMYINNVKASTTEYDPYNVASTFSNAVLYMGRRSEDNLVFNGKLQDIRIYNRILTSDERASLFNE